MTDLYDEMRYAIALAEDRRILASWLIPATRYWRAHGHPSPLLIDGHEYRRRTRARRKRR